MKEMDVARIVDATYPIVRFVDVEGTLREIDATWWANLKGEYYRALRDPGYFSLAEVHYGGMCIGWPDGQDIGPEDIAEFGLPVSA